MSRTSDIPSLNNSTSLAGMRARLQLKNMAVIGLFILPLSVLTGPRIALPFLPEGDLRASDFAVLVFWALFLGAELLLTFEVRHRQGQAIFLAVSSLILVSVAFVVADGVLSFSDFFLGRILELVLIVALVRRMLDIGEGKGLIALFVSVGLGIFLNLIWFGAQVARGKGPLWEVGDVSVYQYGYGLVGDGAPLPSGLTLAITLVLIAAFYPELRRSRLWLLLANFAFTLTLVFLITTNSRISIIIGISIAIFFFSIQIQGQVTDKAQMAAIVSILSLIFFLLVPVSRFDFAGFTRGIEERVSNSWGPALELLGASPFLGVGLGNGRELLGTEFHSLPLFILTDFGLIGALFFIFVLSYFLNKVGKEMSSKFWLKAYLARVTLGIAYVLILSGLVQSSHISITPTHFAAIIGGLILWANQNSPSSANQFRKMPGTFIRSRLRLGFRRQARSNSAS